MYQKTKVLTFVTVNCYNWIFKKIISADVDGSVIEKILKNHDKVVKDTIAQQIANRQNQESKFQVIYRFFLVQNFVV